MQKKRKRKQEAMLLFKIKLEIVNELNALIRDFAERRAQKNMKDDILYRQVRVP
jgi:hypothetical protein